MDLMKAVGLALPDCRVSCQASLGPAEGVQAAGEGAGAARGSATPRSADQLRRRALSAVLERERHRRAFPQAPRREDTVFGTAKARNCANPVNADRKKQRKTVLPALIKKKKKES